MAMSAVMRQSCVEGPRERYCRRVHNPSLVGCMGYDAAMAAGPAGNGNARTVQARWVYLRLGDGARFPADVRGCVAMCSTLQRGGESGSGLANSRQLTF